MTINALAGITAVILAGGKGTRLAPLLGDRPKAIAEVAGRPFLSFLLDQLEAAGIRRVVLAIGVGGDQIRQTFGARYQKLELVYSDEVAPLGTGGALRKAAEHCQSDPVLVLNGDSFCDVCLNDFWAWFLRKKSAMGLVLAPVPFVSFPHGFGGNRRFLSSPNDSVGDLEFSVSGPPTKAFGGDTLADFGDDKKPKPLRYGLVQLDKSERVTDFQEKAGPKKGGFINAGIYLIHYRLIDLIPEGKAVSLERELFPAWLPVGCYGYPVKTGLWDIGTPEAYAEAGKYFDVIARRMGNALRRHCESRFVERSNLRAHRLLRQPCGLPRNDEKGRMGEVR